jgi:hypothetical protein
MNIEQGQSEGIAARDSFVMTGLEARPGQGTILPKQFDACLSQAFGIVEMSRFASQAMRGDLRA